MKNKFVLFVLATMVVMLPITFVMGLAVLAGADFGAVRQLWFGALIATVLFTGYGTANYNLVGGRDDDK